MYFSVATKLVTDARKYWRLKLFQAFRIIMGCTVPKMIVISLWDWAQGHRVSIPWNDGLTFRPMLNKIHQDIPPLKGLVLPNTRKHI